MKDLKMPDITTDRIAMDSIYTSLMEEIECLKTEFESLKSVVKEVQQNCNHIQNNINDIEHEAIKDIKALSYGNDLIILCEEDGQKVCYRLSMGCPSTVKYYLKTINQNRGKYINRRSLGYGEAIRYTMFTKEEVETQFVKCVPYGYVNCRFKAFNFDEYEELRKGIMEFFNIK